MSYTYEIRTLGSAEGIPYIYRVEDSAYIPKDPANSDYQAYLASLNDNPPTTPTATPTA